MSIVPLQHSDIIQFIRYHRARPFPTSTSPTTPATNTMHYSYILLLLCGIASAKNSKRGDFHFIRIYGGRCVQVGGIKTGPKWRIPHTWQDDIKDRLINSDRNGLVWSVVFVLTILDIAVPLSLGLSIPGPETLARFYNICLQPTTAIDD
ncbi:hypothetical protein PtrEW4_007833, partial [Pyrenophora tritici-repentis]